MPVLTKTPEEVFDPLDGGGNPRGADMGETRTLLVEIVKSIEDIEQAATPTTEVVGVTTYNVTVDDVGTTMLVDTLGPPAQDPTTINLCLAADFPNGGILKIKKVAEHTHAGNVVLRGATVATTTGTFSSGAGTMTVASVANIAVGHCIKAAGIPITAKVSAINSTTKVITMVGPDGGASQAFKAGSSVAVTFGEGVDGVFERQIEIHGEHIAIISDGVSKWSIDGGLRQVTGGLVKGTHAVTAASSPYTIDPTTANGMMFMIDTSAGAVTIHVPHPYTMVEGYNPVHMWIDKISGTYPVHVIFDDSSLDYEDGNYPLTIYGVGDGLHIWAAGVNYLTLDKTAAHESGINDLSLSSTTSLRTSNQCAASSNLSVLARKGNRIALPTNGGTASLLSFRVHSLTATLTRDCSVSNGLGSTLGGNGWQNAFLTHKTDGSLAIVLGVANQGDAELTTLDGCKVNGTALTGVAAYSARYLGRVTTNGSSQIIFIEDDLSGVTNQENDVYRATLSPSQITSNQNDYAPTGWEAARVFFVNSDAARNITGLKAPALNSSGRRARSVIFYNSGSQNITFVAGSGSSATENQIGGGNDILLAPGKSIEFTYSYGSLVWVPTGGVPSLGAAVAATVNGLTISTTTGTLTISNSKTIAFQSSMTFNSGVDGNTYAMPSASDTIVGLTASQTITNKILTTPQIAQIVHTSTIGLRPVSGTFAGSTLTAGDAGGGLPITTVNGGTASNAFLSVNAASGVTFNFNVNASGVILQMVANQPMDFYTNNTSRMVIGASGGLTIGSPTGGNKGNGTLNATAVYDDNVLLTDYVFDKFLGIDRREQYSDAVRESFDALDPEMFDIDTYVDHWRKSQSLYGMPSLDDVINKKHSLGGMIQLLWQTTELQAIHIAALADRIAAFEARQ